MMRFASAIGPVMVGVLLASSPVAAQCSSSTPPVKINVPNPGSRATGSSRIAADTDIAISDYVTGFQGPLNIQVFRKFGAGWAYDTAFVPAAGLTGLAVKGDLIAVVSSSGSALTIYKRDSSNNTWGQTSTFTGTFTKNVAFGAGAGAGTVAVALASSVRIYNVDANGIGSLGATVNAPAGASGSSFGFDMAYDDDMLAVGAIGDDTVAHNAGAVYIFRRVGGAWQFAQKILAGSTTPDLHFGQSVALHNGRLVVGAVHSSGIDDFTGIDFTNGYARIYEWDGAAFQLAGHFTHPTLPAATGAAFGHDVAIRGDRAIVTAFLDGLAGGGAGTGFIFDRVNGAWGPHGTIGLTGGTGGWFGSALVMNDEQVFGVAPLLASGSLAMAVFDRCAQPPLPGEGPRCSPGITGLMSYLILFFQHDPSADYNQDTLVNTADVFAYLRDWFAGCP